MRTNVVRAGSVSQRFWWLGLLGFSWIAATVHAADVAGTAVPERVGDLPILAVDQFLRVDRQTLPDRQTARTSAFILKTQPHGVTGSAYVILTDHQDPAFRTPLTRLAEARGGTILTFDDLTRLPADAAQRAELRQKLQALGVRFLAIAPRLESFRENTLLAIWEVAATLDEDPQLDLFPGVLIASAAKPFAALIQRSIEYQSRRPAELQPLALSQVRTASELRSLQKAAVLRKWFARWQVPTPIVAVYGNRSGGAVELTGQQIWNLRAAEGQRFVRRFPAPVSQALSKASLVVMHGHGIPGMSCGVDLEGLPGDLAGKLMLSGSCFAVAPAQSDLAALKQAPGGYRVEARQAFALRAIDQGATVFFGHMRLSAGFPHLFPVLEGWLQGQTIGESHQRLLNAIIAMRGFRKGRFVIPDDQLQLRRIPQNRLLYVTLGDPALRPCLSPDPPQAK